ncbi:MAG TPA: phosphoribosylanthranilate isomerase [Chloroflexota bacterium]|nr:phosphoribosylanthranilate isomerase [Chloroflexota bacterium]
MTAVKICGITDRANGLIAIDAGAEFLGFVFYPPSIRAISVPSAARLIRDLRDARPRGWKAVGVFVNEPLRVVERTREIAGLDVVQLNGEEPTEYIRRVNAPVFKAVRIPLHAPRVAVGSAARHVGAASSEPEDDRDDAEIDVPSAAALGAERILVDANVPGRYGGTGQTYDWTLVRRAVADGFLAGGLTPENVQRAIELSAPWGVDVSSGVECDGVKSGELIERFLAAARGARV